MIGAISNPRELSNPKAETCSNQISRIGCRALQLLGTVLYHGTLTVVVVTIGLPAEIAFSAIIASLLAISILLSAPYLICAKPDTRQKIINLATSIIREIGAVIAVTALYSLDLTWFDPKPAKSDKTPIILVHGYLDNSSSWLYIWWKLKNANIGPVYTINLGPTFCMSIEQCAEKFKEKLQQIAAETGRTDIIPIGHSMGGIVNAYYANNLAEPGTIKFLATIASPLEGTKMAAFGIGRCTKQMIHQSSFVKSLKTGQDFPSMHFWSKTDRVVRPPESATCSNEGAQNIECVGHGHLSLFFSPTVANMLISKIQDINSRIL